MSRTFQDKHSRYPITLLSSRNCIVYHMSHSGAMIRLFSTLHGSATCFISPGSSSILTTEALVLRSSSRVRVWLHGGAEDRFFSRDALPLSSGTL